MNDALEQYKKYYISLEQSKIHIASIEKIYRDFRRYTSNNYSKYMNFNDEFELQYWKRIRISKKERRFEPINKIPYDKDITRSLKFLND